MSNNNNRRQTLGGLSPAALNARQSLGPARIAKDARNAAKGVGLSGRPSLAGGRGPASSRLGGAAAVVPRRSSTYAKAGGLKNDPRPVSDKAYQANCIKSLIAYLSTHGYDQALTPKMLSNPMGKDVMHILQFLMHQVDPYMKIVGKMEDEVPAFFKRMRYPFAISKSALFAVGSPHTWPGLLAALVWLTDLLYYTEKAEHVREETFDEAAKQEADFFSYIATSYKHYLNGDDEECERVDGAQRQSFLDRAEAAQRQVQELDQDIQELQEKVTAMRSEPSLLEAARAELAACEGDRQKFLRLLEQLQVNREALQKRELERQADMRAKQQELAIALQGNQEMRARIAAQTISKEDVLRMNAERVKLEDRLAAVTSARENADGAAAARDMECERQLDHLDSALQAYNLQADGLQLIPASAKRAAGIQYEINLDRGGMTASELVDVDIKGTIKQGLQRQKEAYSGKWRDLEERARGLDDALRSAHQAVAEREEQNAGLDAQVDQLEEEVALQKRAMDADLRERAAEAERLKAAVEELRNATSHDVADSEAAILGLQAQQEELGRSCAAEMEELNADLAEALQLLVDHKLGIQATLQEAHSHLQLVHAEVAAMPLTA